jgi:SAM-dependent methyltransferase
MSLPDKYLAIDEEGYPLLDEVRLKDPEIAREIFQNIQLAENGSFITSAQGQQVLIEAFDEPLVARHLAKSNDKWMISIPFEIEFEFKLNTFTVDEWDRFHGLTTNMIPFVLSRAAQTELFNQCTDYDDDSITIDGKTVQVPPWMQGDPAIENEKYWTNVYQTETPGWELEQPAPALVDLLPRLKLPKSRILVLGCGSGNDAAFFAKDGHHVTAVDFSAEAISGGKRKYSNLTNIKWVQSDIFALGEDFTEAFDVVFEHTCLCAIAPHRRNDLVQIWRRCLAPQGHLLGIFFVMERRSAPPFGGTEWEYRERLKKHFQFLFWGRWRQSISRRNGKELLIYAQKRS